MLQLSFLHCSLQLIMYRFALSVHMRYIMSCKEKCKKDNCTYNKYPPVKSNDHAYRSSNSLSTAKFHRNRKIVAEDTSQCCIKGKKRKETIHGISINHSHDHNSQYTLQANIVRLFRGTENKVFLSSKNKK